MYDNNMQRTELIATVNDECWKYKGNFSDEWNS